MQRFTEHAGQVTRNLHLPHLEDILMDGLPGLAFVQQVLDELKVVLSGRVSGKLSISTKWDGSPALVFGPDPTDGQFFVATKSAFNRVPKLIKSPEDIGRLYGTSSETLQEILACAFTQLQTLQPAHVLQGDVLFWESPPVVDGHFTFQPNTINYAVPVSSPLGERVRLAQFGIVVHTAYVGPSWTEMKAANLAPQHFMLLQKNPDVLVLDATFDELSGVQFASFDEEVEFEHALYQVQNMPLTDGMFDWITGSMGVYLGRYLHHVVREGKDVNVDDFILFLPTKAAPLAQEHRPHVVQWFQLYQRVVAVKQLAIQQLAKASQVLSFINGHVSGPEGFVTIVDAQWAKLVDRPVFSRANFQTVRPS